MLSFSLLKERTMIDPITGYDVDVPDDPSRRGTLSQIWSFLTDPAQFAKEHNERYGKPDTSSTSLEKSDSIDDSKYGDEYDYYAANGHL